MNAGEILDFLDSRQEALLWLANDGRQHLTDARLTVFRSDTDWAVFVEIPHYQAQAAGCFAWVGAVGTCWDEGYLDSSALEVSLLEEATDRPLWKRGVTDDDPCQTWLADRAGFSVMVSGRRFDFTPTVQDCTSAGIVFPNSKAGPGSLPPGYLLRFLCHHLNHPFFASEADLRQAMGQCHDIPLFLQTSGWRHPVLLVYGTDDDFYAGDYVRNVPCFQVLARAIASGDLTEWRKQDPATFNTSWESLEAIRAESNCFIETMF